MTKTRWIKVTVALKEGDVLGEWSAIDLAETEMLQPVGGALSSLATMVQTAARELIDFGYALVPPAVEEETP